MEDTSLDEFLADADARAADAELPTSQWTASGAVCPDCKASVTRLWRDGGTLVCAECKDWG